MTLNPVSDILDTTLTSMILGHAKISAVSMFHVTIVSKNIEFGQKLSSLFHFNIV